MKAYKYKINDGGEFMKYFIITGTSRGLGEAISQKLIKKGNHLFCIARNENSKLINLANNNKVSLDYFSLDLLDTNRIREMMESIFSKINNEEVESIVLINNAATVTPIKPIELCSDTEIQNNIQLNLTAPIILTASFISLASSIKANKRIINISSGAGKKPTFGWSNYSSTKAGVDLFTRSVGLEQKDKDYPVKAISFAPGIIDTEMQAQIRATNKEFFKDIDRFISYKEEGKLLSPDEAAEYVLKLLELDVEGGEVIDIKDFM